MDGSAFPIHEEANSTDGSESKLATCFLGGEVSLMVTLLALRTSFESAAVLMALSCLYSPCAFSRDCSQFQLGN